MNAVSIHLIGSRWGWMEIQRQGMAVTYLSVPYVTFATRTEAEAEFAAFERALTDETGRKRRSKTDLLRLVQAAISALRPTVDVRAEDICVMDADNWGATWEVTAYRGKGLAAGSFLDVIAPRIRDLQHLFSAA
jgi:hypothetical protein